MRISQISKATNISNFVGICIFELLENRFFEATSFNEDFKIISTLFNNFLTNFICF